MQTKEEFRLPIISDDVRFWMIRSKNGIFYPDFILNDYVAVGWNCINKDTDFQNDNLKNKVVEEHPFVSIRSSKRAINKSRMFIHDIKENDIVLLPNKGMSKITIALLGEYYEDRTHTAKEENIFMYQVENGSVYSDIPQCPYIKRRKIKAVRTVEANQVNYHLYNTLRNYNGIDDIDEYAEEILAMIYDIFMYKGRIHVSLEVCQEKDIDINGFSGLLYGTTKYFEPYNSQITAKINVCSSGIIDILFQNGLEMLNTYGPGIFKGFMGLLAGKTIIPQLPQITKEFISVPYEKEKQELEVRKLQNDIKLQELEIKQKKKNSKMIK